nr:uncharacterized protein LOC129045710 [Mirounga angustirostris]
MDPKTRKQVFKQNLFMNVYRSSTIHKIRKGECAGGSGAEKGPVCGRRHPPSSAPAFLVPGSARSSSAPENGALQGAHLWISPKEAPRGSHTLSPDICGWSRQAGRLPEVVLGGKGWGTGGATGTGDPRTLGTRREAITPCLWEAAGDNTWRPHLASVPGVRRAQLFTQDPASSVAAEEARRCDTGPPCPWGWPACLGFQAQEFGAWEPRATSDRVAVGPGSFLARLGNHAWPSWCVRELYTGGLQGQFKPIQRRFSCGILGLGLGRGARAWGQTDGVVPGPSPIPGSSLHPPGSVLSPAATPPPATPTLPPKLRGLSHSTAEEPLVQPGVGRQGRPGSVGKDLHSARRSRTLSCVHLSADGLPCDLPHHSKKSQFPTFPTLHLSLSLSPPRSPGGALSSPSPPHLCQVFSDSAPPLLIS